MNIGIYVSYFPRLSETFIERLIVGLLDAGHDVTIFAHGPGEAAETQDRTADILSRARLIYRGRIPRSWIGRLIAAAVRLPKALLCDAPAALRCLSPRHTGRDALRLRPFLDAFPFIVYGRRLDVVHAQYAHLGERLAKLRSALRPRWRLAVSFRGSDISAGLAKRGDGGYEALRINAELFLPVSEYFYRRLVALGFPPEKTRVLRSGIDLREYEAQPAESPRRNDPPEFRIITVGRLTPKKGMDVCLQGVARFIESHRDSDRRVTLHYDIVGDGPERSRLELLADRLGVSSFTSFHGARAHSDVIHHLRTSDAFLNHSVVGPDGDEEGIPNVIKEAYLSGLPVIASRHAGIPEVVEHKRTGLLVEEQDAAGIAAALDILYRDPSLRVRYAQRGRRLVREEYDGEVISKRLSQLFSSLLKTNAAERSDYGEG